MEKFLIEIDTDVNEHLKKCALVVGESPSSILRRELKLPSVTITARAGSAANAISVESHIPASVASTFPFVADIEFQFMNATRKFLHILSWLHKQHPEKFEIVIGIGGNSRHYFALNEKDLLAQGPHVAPKAIPNSKYWVMTNNSTDRKRAILENLLRIFGYTGQQIDGLLQTF